MKKSTIETFVRMYGMFRYIMRMNENGYHPRMEEIQRHCTYFEEGREEPIHYNTIHNYIRELESLVGIVIRHDKQKGYYIEGLSEWSRHSKRVLYLFDMLWLQSVYDHYGVLRDYILFEPLPDGVKYVPDVMMAILNRHPVMIEYRKPDTGEKKTYRLEPLGLRQFQNRFYVIADNKAWEQPKNFGFHAMQDVTVDYGERFIRQPFSISEYYRDFPGTWVNHSRPAIDVKLRVTRRYWSDFVQNPPIHHSIRKVEEKEGTPWTDFVIHVVPMRDFVQTLLRYAPDIRVLEPATLRNHIIERLEASLAAYSSLEEPVPEVPFPASF